MNENLANSSEQPTHSITVRQERACITIIIIIQLSRVKLDLVEKNRYVEVVLEI